MAGPTLGKIWVQGPKASVVSLRLPSGSEPATEFIDALDAASAAKLRALFSIYADLRDMRNPQKFKKIEGSDGIFEFKDFQVRLLCFTTPGSRLVLFDGEIKKSMKLSPQLIRRAEQARSELLSELKQMRVQKR